jgi:lipoyl(octanoyl) transferase
MWFEDRSINNAPGHVLHAYLLGLLDYEDGLLLQRYFLHQVACEPNRTVLVLCEHPPLISVGRQGSHSHILFEEPELHARRWPVRWVNRGGGCFLHLPGQLALYPILPLRQLGLGVQEYLARLHRVLIDVLADFSVQATTRPGQTGVWVRQRLIAAVGVAVCDWVSWHGAILNVAPDLLPFRRIQTGASCDGPMTSLARERHGSPRMAHVRQSLVEHFQERFQLARTSIFFSHPLVRSERIAEPVIR